jgi:hypothetical protein
MRNARQLSVFLVWDEFTSQNFRFHLRFPTLSLTREMLSTQPSVRGEALSLYVFYILFFFVSLYLRGVVIYRVFTYLEHSLRVVYWPGIVFVIFDV